MPSNLLERRIQLGLPTSLVTLSSTQILLDQSLQQAGDALSDPIALTAMGVAPVFGKLGRMGSVWGAERWLGTIPQLVTKYFGSLAGFGTEVFAFEGIQRSLRVMVEGADPSLLKWEHLKEGLVHSFINLGILKLGNTATAGTNPILSHFVTDSAMVAGHHVAATFGMMPAPTESLLQQFVQADAMNWQMKGGMSLFHVAAPSWRLREWSFELSWYARAQASSALWGLRLQAPSMASQYSKGQRALQIDPVLSRLRDELQGNFSEEQCKGLLERAAESLKARKDNPVWHRILDEMLSSDRPLGPIELAVELRKSPASIDTAIHGVNRALYAEARKLAEKITRPSLNSLEEAETPLNDRAEGLNFSAAFLDREVESIAFPARAAQAMKYARIRYVGELVQKTAEELGQIPNCGRTTVKQIKGILEAMGLSLGMKLENWEAKPPGEGQALASHEIPPDLLASPIDVLSLSDRVLNILRMKPEIRTVADLIRMKESDLRRRIGFGSLAFKEVKDALSAKGLRLKGKPSGNEAFLDKLNIPIVDLEFSSSASALSWKLRYVGELVQKSETDLREMRVGTKAIMEIIETLRQLGLHLGMVVEDWKPPTSG